MTIDQHGNVHAPSGAPGGGQFTGRTRPAPQTPLTRANSLLRAPADVDPELRAKVSAVKQAVADALVALRDFPAPRLGVSYVDGYDDEDADNENAYALTCPYCTEQVSPDEVKSVDMAERWASAHTVNAVEGIVAFDYDISADFDGLYYMTACCGLPVELPENWIE